MTQTKRKLLLAAENQFLRKGYNATTVDEICAMARATKGAFFHHFRSKSEIALRALEQNTARRVQMLTVSRDEGSSARQRVIDYFDRLERLTDGEAPSTCLIAVLTLELSEVDASLSAACATAYEDWMNELAELILDALPDRDEEQAVELTTIVMSSYQGALLLARARRRPEVVTQALASTRAYVLRQLSGRTAEPRPVTPLWRTPSSPAAQPSS